MPSREKQVNILFNSYYSQLCKRAFAITGSMDDAEEVVQDVFVSLWKSDTIINEISYPLNYLSAAVRNKSISFIQSSFAKNKKAEVADFDSEAIGTIQEDSIQDTEAKAVVYQAINTLPPKCKEVFLLSREAELPYKQIAEELDISIKTVENQISIALKKIQAYLELHWF